MFSDDVIDGLLERNTLPKEEFAKLLSLYIAPINWMPYIDEFYIKNKKNAVLLKQAISFTILLPVIEPTFRPDPDSPQRLLFGCRSFSQFDSNKDWFAVLKKTILDDQRIVEDRKKILALGYIDPIDYQPYTRQAYKWLCERAEEEGVLDDEVRARFRKLVMTYGGAVISYVFTKHSGSLKRVVNWRTGYFIEKVIHSAYDVDQIRKIKSAELAKTNEKWVKHIDSKPKATNANAW